MSTQSPVPAALRTILVADCGTAMTKLSLIAHVEGQARFLARGVAPIHANDPTYQQSVLEALHSIESVTGLHIQQRGQITQAKEEFGEGVDAFIVSTSNTKLIEEYKGLYISKHTALGNMARFLAQHYAMNITLVDIGNASTDILLAEENGTVEFYTSTTMGLGLGMVEILREAGLERITRWLSFPITEQNVREHIANRILSAADFPQTEEQAALDAAFARESILLTLKSGSTKWKEFHADLILTTGGFFAHTPSYGHVLLTVLDTFQVRGITSIIPDRNMLLPQVGALATLSPTDAVQVNEHDAILYRLGTCICPYGTIRKGEVALTIDITYLGNVEGQSRKTYEIQGGSIQLVPLAFGQQASITLHPAEGVDIGLGPGESAHAEETVQGGIMGLIIDARGRPLHVPASAEERQQRQQAWLKSVNMKAS